MSTLTDERKLVPSTNPKESRVCDLDVISNRIDQHNTRLDSIVNHLAGLRIRLYGDHPSTEPFDDQAERHACVLNEINEQLDIQARTIDYIEGEVSELSNL